VASQNRIVVLLFTALVLVLGSRNIDAQNERVTGVVKDTAGNPLQGVTITITTDAREDFSMTKSTNKKGKFIIVHMDVALTYTYTFEKEGYQTFTHEVRPLDVYDSLEFVMLTLEQAGQVTDQPISGRARAVKT